MRPVGRAYGRGPSADIHLGLGQLLCGATRFTVAAASALENGLLGIVAGLTGGGLAFALVQAGVVYGKIRIEVPLQPLGAAALAGGLLAVLVGVGSTLDVLGDGGERDHG